MTTVSNSIPDEIMKVARDIAASRYVGSQWSHMREYFADGLYDNDPVVVSAAKAIQDAVMAERERCIDLARKTIIDARTGEIDTDLRSIAHILERRMREGTASPKAGGE